MERVIAIYSRKSRFTGKGESVGNQAELCRGYIRSFFGEAAPVQVFEDEGFSGGNLHRPGFQRMLRAAREGQLRAIVVYRLDRISRNISDFSGLIDELTGLEVAFISIREQFDTGTPMGRAMMYIISVFSQLERETIAQRIRDNMQELAKTGRWLGGNTPTGFASESVTRVTVDGKTHQLCRLRLIPEEAETVYAVFHIYSATGSLTATETQLEKMGLRSKTGRPLSRFAIRGLLTNPVYMTADAQAYAFFAHRGVQVYSDAAAFDGTRGIMAYNRTDQEKGRTTLHLPMEQWIVAVGEHPGLISGEMWLQVQTLLAGKRRKTGKIQKSLAKPGQVPV